MLTTLGEAKRAEYSACVDNRWFRQTLRVKISPKVTEIACEVYSTTKRRMKKGKRKRTVYGILCLGTGFPRAKVGKPRNSVAKFGTRDGFCSTANFRRYRQSYWIREYWVENRLTGGASKRNAQSDEPRLGVTGQLIVGRCQFHGKRTWEASTSLIRRPRAVVNTGGLE